MAATASTSPRFDPQDPLSLDAALAPDEIAVRDTVAKFCAEHVRPHIADWFEVGDLPARELAKGFGELGQPVVHRRGAAAAVAAPVHAEQAELADEPRRPARAPRQGLGRTRLQVRP